MTKITIEQAERILVKARRRNSDGDLTDLQLARERHNALRDSGYTMIIFSLGLARATLSQDWNALVGWSLALSILGLGAYMIYQSSQYSKIRELFESAAPQSLAELKPHLEQSPLL